MPWYAVYTNRNNEITVSDRLREQIGGEVYVPLIPGRGTGDGAVLLFRNYVFIKTPMTPELREKIANTRGVGRLVGARPSEPSPINDLEIQAIRQFAENPRFLEPGEIVEITAGNLEGKRGVVLRLKRTEATVSLSIPALLGAKEITVPLEILGELTGPPIEPAPPKKTRHRGGKRMRRHLKKIEGER